ncbi:uncharacterized protein LOC122650895 [Telopea speciosissima]|uniref:uncharacterized protein LOC122650895 n=1 Tax=Telopea speciosissima TaxID=54955 RepID=UPI001CC45313|nr:uncharacterized protein LOC122650895 [Telopea speciosissima]
MKFMLPDMIQEMEVMCDMDVLKMFCVAEQLDAVEVIVYNVQASEEITNTWTINGYPDDVVGRDECKSRDSFYYRSSSRSCAKLSDILPGFEHVRLLASVLGGVGVVKVSSQSTTTIGDTNAKWGGHVDSSSQTATIQESSAQGGGEDDSGTKDATDDEGFVMSDSDDEEWKEGSEDEIETSTDSSDGESDGYSEHSKSEEVERKDELSDYQSDEEEGLKGVNQEGERISLQVGQIFTNVYAFRAALADYSIQEGFEFMRQKNEKSRVTVICKGDGCMWRCHASPIDEVGTYMIKTYISEHTCVRVSTNNNATSTWMAKKLEEKLRSDPDLKKETMKQLLKDKWQLEPHKMQYYRARVRAREWIEGSHAESYALLPKYGNKLLEKNAGSNYVIESELRTVLLKEVRVFKKGFLNGSISVDGNNGLFPVAFGVVESECKDSWIFFLQHLHDSIYTEMELPITFMTDKQKGLSQAIAQIFPYANHKYCARHLHNNFKVNYPGALLKSHFWVAVRAYNPIQFQRSMNAMKSLNKEAHDWLMKNPVSAWARHAFDHRIKSDHVTNNMTESFNQWIG